VAVQPDREEVTAAAATRLKTILEICVCPDCYSNLESSPGGLRCTKCGREFEIRDGIPILLPSSTDDTGQRYLANYEPTANADLEKPFEINRPARHRALQDFIGSVTDRRVLDIGSSDAMYLREMDASVKVAIDIAVEYLVQIPESSGVLGVCGDAEHLPIGSGYFDVVIIADVLEHVLHADEVVKHLVRVSRPDTRLIVHVPWEEDLGQYRDLPYEFVHLRSFNSYNFGVLFRDFYERRSRSTGTYLTAPLQYRLYGILPRPLYNWLMLLTWHTRWGRAMGQRMEKWRQELPRRERWLLLFYRPVYRQFELRLWRGTLRSRIETWLRNKIGRERR
jgi:SAM-dependent methyltransferase